MAMVLVTSGEAKVDGAAALDALFVNLLGLSCLMFPLPRTGDRGRQNRLIIHQLFVRLDTTNTAVVIIARIPKEIILQPSLPLMYNAGATSLHPMTTLLILSMAKHIIVWRGCSVGGESSSDAAVRLAVVSLLLLF